MRTAINAIITNENGKILLVLKRQSWILPGGKPNPCESDLECLCREVKEELSGTELENFRYYKNFEGITPHKGDMLNAIVYFADIKGSLNQSSMEIDTYAWVSRDDIGQYNLSDITSKIVDSLIKDGYLRRPSD